MKNVCFFSIIFLFLSGCNTKGEKDFLEFDINKSMGIQSGKKLSDFVEDITYIPLETNHNILTGHNLSVYSTGKNFITFDLDHCFLFDIYGQFIDSIGNKGKGPDEFLYAHDGYFSPINNHIYIQRSSNGSLLEYSLSGDLVQEIKRPKNGFLNTRPISSELFVGYRSNVTGDSKWNFMIFNKQGDSISVIPNQHHFIAKNYTSFIDECIFYYYDKKLYFKEQYNDTIYRFKQDGDYLSQHVLNTGKYKVPSDIKADGKVFNDTYFNDYFAINNIIECSTYLIINYLHNNMNNILICNKHNGQIDNFQSSEKSIGIFNDWDGGMNLLPTNSHENTVIQIINSFELKTHVASITFKNSTPKYPEKKKALEELANSLDENDNPVLMLVKLKE